MNKIICTLSIVILPMITLSQQLLIVFEHNPISLPSEILMHVPELQNQKIISRYSLYINNGRSEYTKDSLFLDQDKPFSGFSPFHFKKIYKDYNNDLWIENSGVLKKGYCLLRSISNLKKKYEFFDWEITDEKKSIVGMECIKAIAKNGNVAWFAPGIPYPDGPEDGVFNLPGLVLSYETPYHQWKAVESSFNKRSLVHPTCTLETDEDKTRVPVFDLKNQSLEEHIRIDKNTPLKKWISFN